MLGSDDQGCWSALEWRSAGDNAVTARDLCRQNSHVSGGEQWILAAGDVATDAVDGNMLVAEHDARHRLNFQLRHCVELGLSKISDLILCELDVLTSLRRDAVHAGVDLRFREAITRPVETIETDSQFPDGFVTTSLDIGNKVLDCSRNGFVMEI
ncbi:hypothetical protein D9M70_481980 [compost metagenome]